MNAWYSELYRPPLTPPSWIFGPLWSLLYLMIAASIILYVRQSLSDKPYTTYALILVHLTCNFIWTLIFFRLKSPGWAFVDIVILDLTLIIMIILFWQVSRAASILLWPYAIWVLFATYLNIGFYYLMSS